MKKIEDLDENFKIETNIGKDNVKFYNALEKQFCVFGVFYENGKYRRMHETDAKRVSQGVYALHTHTAGGRVRFKTDSSYVAVAVKYGELGKMPHFALTGSVGLDLYVKENGVDTYKGSFKPPFDIEKEYEGVVELGKPQMREITINFPLYSEVCELYIGVAENAVIEKPNDYRIKTPVVYHGSSITQGGCASRPGNSYQGIISRRFDCDYINLGFSGNAKAEDEMADYIKKLDMSLFVYDYDHNSPSCEHLAATHEKMFCAIRKENPYLPIIMMPRPRHFLSDWEKERYGIIEKTYNHAIAAGDKNVYFITNKELTDFAGNDGLVDDCHPNDLGFMSMAKAVGNTIEKNHLL